jgi:hypothetical protein
MIRTVLLTAGAATRLKYFVKKRSILEPSPGDCVIRTEAINPGMVASLFIRQGFTRFRFNLKKVGAFSLNSFGGDRFRKTFFFNHITDRLISVEI